MSESKPIESEEMNKITSVAERVVSAQSSSQLKEILETSKSEENIITELNNKCRRKVITYLAIFVFITSYITLYLLVQISKRSSLIGKQLPIQIDDNSETISINELN
ncbi:hypothetical protein EDI_315940 [Entamoeba dispar SAW760]|uniref:Uncharacterized protein n=1 Tax=Entamoeba dispar (strain ATCC PRA-260 / SAW760) TaxID=370354 RepID=B0EAH6_ENTDS|nr:uncharacterized protein EDI_315940 [Entamoeba dispar SAW760]EDR28489.1 hypothetical protein EDI_315940 [Entamoeba dispar SAW760]|eukprot:EDR28489.1 hypothetical protein EDI_315940 [Entamoeba dispar SAW760]